MDVAHNLNNKEYELISSPHISSVLSIAYRRIDNENLHQEW